MISHRRSARILAGTLSAVAVVSLCQMSVSYATGAIDKDDLTGPWAISLIGDTGCGSTTMLATGSLNATGQATVTVHGHSAGCGDTTSTEKFDIVSLNGNGSGTASLSCNNNTGCGWTFKIQVAPDRSVFSLVDITDGGNNRLQGVAIHQ
jgi:hypothetical protein